MMAMSVRLSKRGVMIVLFVCLTIISGLFLFSKRNQEDVPVDKTNPTVSTITSVKAKNNSERVQYLANFGWEVEEIALEVKEVVVPEFFDETMTRYNEIQKQQGMDLEKFAGKRIKRYTYSVINHPSGDAGVRANILVYNDKIVGGDICTVKIDGFMHGFTMGETQASTIIYDEALIQKTVSEQTEVIETAGAEISLEMTEEGIAQGSIEQSLEEQGEK